MASDSLPPPPQKFLGWSEYGGGGGMVRVEVVMAEAGSIIRTLQL